MNTVAVTNDYTEASKNAFTYVKVLGIKEEINQVTVNNEQTTDFTYDQDNENLTINLRSIITEPLVVHWFN